MIVNDVAFKVEREGIDNEVSFNIRQENVAHIFSILRNQLYSNKVLAVVREYSTNAFDAHIEANVERPIEITLPTSFSPTFIVRDFGFGLSPDDVQNIFASYGASTKRNTNEQVGMLGLGSKSAFCYVNSFMIISRHNGTEYTYQAYIDETNVGKVALLSTKTTEETGLSIHININSAIDYSNFRQNAVSFFKNFNPIPKFFGDSSISDQIEEARNVVPVLEGGNWKMYRKNYYGEGDLAVLMGNVLYPATLDSLDYDAKKYIQNSRSHVVLTANIGDVKPSASRENLEMDNKTKDFINNAIKSIQTDIITRITESLDEKQSLWSKSIHKRNIDSQFMHIVNVSSITTGIPTSFNEKKLKEYGISYILVETSNKSFKKTHDIAPFEGHTLFVDDVKLKRNSIKPRILSYCLQNNIKPFDTFKNSRKFVLTFESEQKAKEFKDQPDFDGARIVYLNEIPYTAPIKTKTTIGKKTINAQFYKINPSLGRHNSKCWTPVDEVEENAVYFPIEYFKSTSIYAQEPYYILEYTRLINQFLTERGEEPVAFYGVKKALLKNVPDTMRSFDDFVQEFKDLVMTGYAEEYNNWAIHTNLDHRWKALFFSNKNHFPSDVCGKLEKIESDFKKINIYQSIWSGLRFDTSKKPFSIMEEYIERFPLLVPAVNGNLWEIAEAIGKEF